MKVEHLVKSPFYSQLQDYDPRVKHLKTSPCDLFKEEVNMNSPRGALIDLADFVRHEVFDSLIEHLRSNYSDNFPLGTKGFPANLKGTPIVNRNPLQEILEAGGYDTRETSVMSFTGEPHIRLYERVFNEVDYLLSESPKDANSIFPGIIVYKGDKLIKKEGYFELPNSAEDRNKAILSIYVLDRPITVNEVLTTGLLKIADSHNEA